MRSFQQVAFENLKDLEASMASLSGKLVPMGQRLESLEVPRARAQEAHTLLDFILQFHQDGRPSDIFTNPKRVRTKPTVSLLINPRRNIFLIFLYIPSIFLFSSTNCRKSFRNCTTRPKIFRPSESSSHVLLIYLIYTPLRVV